MASDTALRRSYFACYSYQGALRVAVLSALGLYGGTFNGAAWGDASCQGFSVQTFPEGSYGSVYAVCEGKSGQDRSGEKDGDTGPSISISTVGGVFAGNTSDIPSVIGQSAIGVLTGMSIGGSGVDEGSAGEAGSVSITNQADVSLGGSTVGPYNSAISAVSLGGQGDAQNDNNNSNGGRGGLGQWVSVSNTGNVSVAGTVLVGSSGLYGIKAVAQGGDGGVQNNPALNYGDQVGGDGANASTVSVTNSGGVMLGASDIRLRTNGVAAGISASSVGGDGGNYNSNAGTGGTVAVTHRGQIANYWQRASDGQIYGIIAESLGANGIGANSNDPDNSDDGGAGGGDSGNWSQRVTVDTYGTVLLSLTGSGAEVEGGAIVARAVGGKGGDGPPKNKTGGKGGDAGVVAVNVYSGGSVQTDGDNLPAVVAQSVGGQGGNGGDGTALAGQGGGGGFGGNAGTVDILMQQDTRISTSGMYSSGVIAQSIGGGGGTGSDFVSVLGGQGGNGGNGGNAGVVAITTAADIATAGAHAYGALGQSIAGSGGAGGADTSVYVAMGGDGAGGGVANNVTIQNSGSIVTSGYGSHGVIGQSIGGGGGASGSATGLLSVGGNAAGQMGSDGALVTIANAGRITTSANAAIGVVAQSIGGGGGSGSDSIGIVGVGGRGASGGRGGAVNLNDLGTIQTSGDFSFGVLAQSVGGGGGNGGDTLTASAGVSLAIGGSGSGGGDGGSVCLSNQGACNGDASSNRTTILTHGDYASGIVAQSIGGGGGSGGKVKNVSVASFAALQLGGNASGGGSASDVTVQFENLTIGTGGAHAMGVLAQSVGGGGGNGGDASYYDGTIGFNAALVLGGSGGAGGVGGAATVELSNSFIATGIDYANPAIDAATYAPNDAFGVLAQTIGGGGGNGGSSSASDLVLAVPTGEGASLAFNFQAALGGVGGAGGDACASSDAACTTRINVNEGSSVATLGDGSHAVVAQSIGGGGGNGGDSSVLSTVLGDKTTISLAAGVSLGGSGGVGGHGGAINVTLGDEGSDYATLPASLLDSSQTHTGLTSSVTTYGNYANGLLAQSIGGGGGNGGVGSSNAYTYGGPANIDMTLTLGGTGGSAGDGGSVELTVNPNYVIRTLGSGSRGVAIQSIGGGGGVSQGGGIAVSGSAKDRPSARLQIGLGADGGSGGVGGDIRTTIRGAIKTEGGDADGVLVQSIGGGGGLGGSAGADASSHPILDRIGQYTDNKQRISDEGSTYTFGIDVGGSGGVGAHGGAVDVVYAGKVSTRGDWADGIVAQSIGGGGGVGGTATASGSQVRANIDISVGGRGGSGGDAQAITFYFDDNHDNLVSTEGYGAYGVLFQSIGGGGGQGGDGSDQAQGTLTVGASGGGTGGVAGDGGSILTSTSQGWLNVQTQGDDAPAVVLQSIGGGGGTAGAGNSSAAKQEDSLAVGIAVGGQGGLSGSGGDITVATGLAATTYGDRAYGMLSQSIGGGGGIGGAGSASNLAGVALGGRGGASGEGGKVNVVLNTGSRITTYGMGSHGVIAQSIGGGGGIAGDTSQPLQLLPDSWLPSAGATGGNGNGSEVVLSLDGVIAANGANAIGVVAQSLGGGGGLSGDASGGFAGSTAATDNTGRGGNVAITQGGTVSAQGAGSTGIFAQSAGPEGSGDVTIVVNGSVYGGSGPMGNGVWISGDAANRLSIGIDGVVSASSGGTAVRYDVASLQAANRLQRTSVPGNTTLSIHNAGTLSGNILCNGATGTANCITTNASTGTLRDASLYETHIVNEGLLSVGSHHGAGTLTINGDLRLASQGIVQTFVNFDEQRAPHLTVKGATHWEGTLKVLPLTLLPDRTVTVATLEGEVHGEPAVFDSPVINYDAVRIGREVQVKAASASFVSPQMLLQKSPRSVARHIQQSWDRGGSSALATLYAALDMASRESSNSYKNHLSDLSLGVAVVPGGQMQAGMARFNGAMMSCPSLQTSEALGKEQNCVWGQISGAKAHQDGTGGVSGFSLSSVGYQVGAQHEIKPNWFLGGSVAYQNSHLHGGDGRVSGTGDSGYAGAVLKHEDGPWSYSAAISGGYGNYDMERRVRIPGLFSRANSTVDVYGGAIRLRAARTFASEYIYWKPYVDLDMHYTYVPSYRESRNAAHLDVDSSDQFVVGLSPTLEVGGRVPLNNGAMMRPYLYGGVSVLSQDEYTVHARLQGAPVGSGSYRTSVPMGGIIGRLGAGLQVSNVKGLDFRLHYDGEFSSHVTSHRGLLKVMMPF